MSFADISGIPASHIWLRPLGILYGSAARAAVVQSLALPLAGGDLAFGMIEILARRSDGGILTAAGPLDELRRWSGRSGAAMAQRIEQQLERLSVARLPWAALPLDRPLLMGVVNVTPDSFSDGGDFIDPAQAIARGRALLEAGADILDIGGESTRPGADPVTPEEEIRRVEPVIRALAEGGAPVSIDTRHAPVMAAAMAAGARIINDVSALAGDPESLATAARTGASVVLMHMAGEPRTMQKAPQYTLASLDVLDYLEARIARCEAAGIARDRIVVDPGIGFGKNKAHNLEIMARLGLFHVLGCGVMLGVSRKSLIGHLTRTESPKERGPGSLAGALFGLAQGVQVLRVHDVAETRQAVLVWQAAARGG